MTTYRDWHGHLRKTRGPASDYPCNDCGKKAKDWALMEERATTEILFGRHGRHRHRYALEPDAYVPLCRKCHMQLDMLPQANRERHTAKTHCKYGHLFDEQNTYFVERVNCIVRQCKTCQIARKQAWRERQGNV